MYTEHVPLLCATAQLRSRWPGDRLLGRAAEVFSYLCGQYVMLNRHGESEESMDVGLTVPRPSSSNPLSISDTILEYELLRV